MFDQFKGYSFERKKLGAAILIVLLLVGAVWFFRASKGEDKVKIQGIASSDQQAMRNAKMKVKNLELQLKNFTEGKDSYSRLDYMFLCDPATVVINGKFRGSGFQVLEKQKCKEVFPTKIIFQEEYNGRVCMKTVHLWCK